MVSGGDSGILRIWDCDDPKDRPWAEFQAGQKETGQIRFLSDNVHFVSSGGDSTVNLWDRTLGADQKPQLLFRHRDTVHAPWVAVRGGRVASCGEDGVIHLWDQSLGKRELVREDGRTNLSSVAFSLDGKLLAVGDARGVVQLWDYEAGKFLKSFPAHVSAVQAIAFSRDGRRVATGGDDKAVRVWDLDTNRILLDMISHTDAVTALCFTSDDGILASSSEDGSIRIWEAPKQDHQAPATPR
jgi:WD40 repeat protein